MVELILNKVEEMNKKMTFSDFHFPILQHFSTPLLYMSGKNQFPYRIYYLLEVD